MAELRKDIPVTYEFEDYIPPEEDGVIFEPQDDSRMVMAERSSGEPFNPPDSWYTAEPDVAYTLGVEDKEKREAFLKSMPDPIWADQGSAPADPLERRIFPDALCLMWQEFHPAQERTMTMPGGLSPPGGMGRSLILLLFVGSI